MDSFFITIAVKCNFIVFLQIISLFPFCVGEESVLGFIPSADAFIKSEFLRVIIPISDFNHIVKGGISLTAENRRVRILTVLCHFDLFKI